MNATDPTTQEPIDYEKEQGRSTSLGKQFKKVDAFYLNRSQPTKDDVDRLKEVLKKPGKNQS